MKINELRSRIQQLIQLKETESPTISCYLDLQSGLVSTMPFFRERIGTIFKSLAPEEATEFEQAADEIESWLNSNVDSETGGVAIFARSGNDPFFIPLSFPVAMPNWISCDNVPNIFYLVEMKDKYHRFVILLSTENSARILEVNLGEVTEDFWKKQPELRKRIGREWTHEHYQNHKRDRDQKFIKEKVQILEKLMNGGGYRHLVLAGSPQRTARIRNSLPKKLQEYIVDFVSITPQSEISDVIQEAISTFIVFEEQESREKVNLLKQAILKQGLAVFGAHQTMTALARGQVDVLLMMKDFEQQGGWKCTTCHTTTTALDEPTHCIECSAKEFQAINIREHLVQLAEKTGAEIEIVNESKELEIFGGVGSLLRYALPQSQQKMLPSDILNQLSSE